jgi:hypothetical protein
MRRAIPALLMLLLWPSRAAAAVVNLEFKFTPFLGDPAKDVQVETVAGTARVFINGVPVATQEVRTDHVPVLFDDREIGPSVWIPMRSAGPVVRKGKNTIRVEFEPTDTKAAYRAQLRWASVMDEATEQREPGRVSATNQDAEGVDDKRATGTMVFEREFTADFVADVPWHHFPAVTELSDEDKRRLTAMLQERVGWFKPDFSALYKSLTGMRRIDVGAVRKAQCLDAAYKEGVRVAAPAADQLEFVTSGNPEVVVRQKRGELFGLDPKGFERVKGEARLCAEMTVAVVYPPQLAVVRMPNGSWEVVY